MFKPSKPNLISTIYIIIVTTYCRRWINTKKSTVPKCLSLKKKNWHVASKTSCGAPHDYELLRFCLVFVLPKDISFISVCRGVWRDFASLCLVIEEQQKKKKTHLVLIFPQICRCESWSPTPRVLAQWLCWHRPKLSTPPPTPFPRVLGV